MLLYVFLKNKIYKIILFAVLFLAFFLRIKAFLIVRPLWHDEASLAMSILGRYNLMDFFTPLDFFQKAPPFFMSLTEFITRFFGSAEPALRTIPFISSLISVILFNILSSRILKKKISILLSNYLFAVNYQLIYYAQEFKQYSSDVMFVMLSVLIFTKVDFETVSYKRLILLSLISIIMIFFSYPAAIVIGAVILLNLFKFSREKLKKIIIFSLPIVITAGFYFKFLLLPLQSREVEMFGSYWQDGFITLSLSSVYNILKINLLYFFIPNHLLWFLTALFLFGLYFFIKEKTREEMIILLTILFAIAASALQIYPLKERIALYLLPFIILIINKPLDRISLKRKIYSAVLVLVVFFSFYSYNFHYMQIFSQNDIFKNQDTRILMSLVSEKFKESDILVYNKASTADYYYYKAYFNFQPQQEICINLFKPDKKDYEKELRKLNKNQNYWFFYPYHLNNYPEISFVTEWIKENNLKASFYVSKKSFAACITPCCK